MSKMENWSAKIKDVFIELKNYKFYHSPFSNSKGDTRFIGRDKIKRRIVNILSNTKTKSGAYLITGFRGMGKTSILRLAIHEYNKVVRDKNSINNKTKIISFSRLSSLLRLIVYFTFLISITWLFWNDHLSFYLFWIVPTFFVFLIILEFSGSNQFKKDSWKLFKVCIITVVLLLCISFFAYPQKFCSLFNCLFVDNKLYSFFDFRNFSLTYLAIRSLIGLILAYVIIVISCAIKDLLYYHIKFFFALKKDGNNANLYETIEINLAQDRITERDILKRLTNNLLEFWEKNRVDFTNEIFSRKIYYPFSVIRKLLSNNSKNTRVNYELILDRLTQLNNRIVGELTSQNDITISPNLSTGLSHGLTRFAVPLGKISKKNAVYFPIASSKEIEDELISIFKLIEKLRDLYFKYKHVRNIPEFIFIVDELDKMLPASNSSIEEKEYSNPSLDFLHNLPGVTKTRRRQEAVAKLLANLKGFLNVVRAKFFFIGGREMFDADLADIADRDAFYSSVFNDVIYVESFLKDKVEARAGITQMIEVYLCNMILKDFSIEKDDNKNYNLKELSKKILVSPEGELFLGEDNAPNMSCHNSSDYEASLKKFKILSILQNYIIYLTYRSNGTPKKLAALTEGIIYYHSHNKNSLEPQFKKENLVVDHQQNVEKPAIRTYLRFKFNFQYEIGLTADLYRPFIIVNSRHFKSLGDKLLFSSAFIMDHILKFHPFGFSWRNLELIPEVILVNKEPNLRGFIEELISFLSLTYIRTTVSGIFQYKFYSKINKELTYLSKTSDLSAAAFNFTLDESLQIKRHYKKKLIELREKYKDFKPIEGDNHFVHSIAFIQTILGDLYFYDKEFDEALLYYTESIQSLRLPRKVDSKLLTRHQFYIWLRNKLRLGLTLEKMRAYDSAISYYRTLILDSERFIAALVDMRDDVKKEGEEHKFFNYKSPNAHRDIQMLSMPYIAYLGLIEKSRSDGITYANLFNTNLEFENLIGKRKIKGIGNEVFEIDRYRRDFLFADFYNNIGSILFYKNCLFPKLYERSKYKLNFLSKRLINQLKLIGDKKSNTTKVDKSIRLHDYHPSLSSFCYYWGSATYLLDYHFKARFEFAYIKKGKAIIKKDVLSTAALYLLPENIDLINANRFYYLANVISKLGDSILASLSFDDIEIPKSALNPLSLISREKEKHEDKIESIKPLIRYFYNAYNGKEGHKIFSIQSVLNVYKLASALYLRAGRVYSHSFQQKKILYVIKDLVSLKFKELEGENNEFNDLLNFLDEKDRENGTSNKYFKSIESIAEEIFKNTSWNYSISNRPQILKYRDILGEGFERDILYNGISNANDNREVVLIINGIKLKVATILNKRLEKELELKPTHFPIEKKPFISAYSMISSRYLRVLELKYRSEYFYYLLTETLGLSWLKDHVLRKEGMKIKKCIETQNDFEKIKSEIEHKFDFFKEASIFDILTFLVQQSLFCLREIIKMVNIYSPSYIISYSYLAEAHRRMGIWCIVHDNIKFLLNACGGEEEKLNKFDNKIKEILGQHALVYLEGNYHFESAKQNFYNTIQMHTEGRKYKSNILKIYALEDDYNDNLTHFSIALERLRVNTGTIRLRINELNKKVKDSRVYKLSSYILTEDEERNKKDDKNKIDWLKEFKDFLDEKI